VLALAPTPALALLLLLLAPAFFLFSLLVRFTRQLKTHANTPAAGAKNAIHGIDSIAPAVPVLALPAVEKAEKIEKPGTLLVERAAPALTEEDPEVEVEVEAEAERDISHCVIFSLSARKGSASMSMSVPVPVASAGGRRPSTHTHRIRLSRSTLPNIVRKLSIPGWRGSVSVSGAPWVMLIKGVTAACLGDFAPCAALTLASFCRLDLISRSTAEGWRAQWDRRCMTYALVAARADPCEPTGP
jgi:hypothetical protein